MVLVREIGPVAHNTRRASAGPVASIEPLASLIISVPGASVSGEVPGLRPWLRSKPPRNNGLRHDKPLFAGAWASGPERGRLSRRRSRIPGDALLHDGERLSLDQQ